MTVVAIVVVVTIVVVAIVVVTIVVVIAIIVIVVVGVVASPRVHQWQGDSTLQLKHKSKYKQKTDTKKQTMI